MHILYKARVMGMYIRFQINPKSYLSNVNSVSMYDFTNMKLSHVCLRYAPMDRPLILFDSKINLCLYTFSMEETGYSVHRCMTGASNK